MSIKGRISRYFDPVDYSTENEDYSAEELAEEAADILGKDSLKTLRGSIIRTIEEIPMYETRSGRGVKVNSRRSEPYEALDRAAESLREEDEELLEE